VAGAEHIKLCWFSEEKCGSTVCDARCNGCQQHFHDNLSGVDPIDNSPLHQPAVAAECSPTELKIVQQSAATVVYVVPTNEESY